MDNLEKYIKDNAEAFNDAELPGGHLDRFERKLDSLAPADVQTIHGRRIRKITFAFLAVAAAIAAVLLLNRPHGLDLDLLAQTGEHHKDWFAEIGDDQVDICRAYYDKVAEMYDVILSSHPDGSMEGLLSSLAEESVPLIDQLPDEMDPESRAAVLKEYYGELLDGLDRMNIIK